MNYLHGGSKAPRITVETANDSIDRDTTWRLLWRDDRYTDGTIPEEESGYRFTRPEQVQPPAPAIRSLDDILMAESGSAVPKAGRWLPLSDLAAGVHLQKGEIRPLHQGCAVSWILSKH